MKITFIKIIILLLSINYTYSQFNGENCYPVSLPSNFYEYSVKDKNIYWVNYGHNNNGCGIIEKKGVLMLNKDTENFLLGNRFPGYYGTDGQNIYWGNTLILGADRETFGVLHPHYSYDKYNVYYNGVKMIYDNGIKTNPSVYGNIKHIIDNVISKWGYLGSTYDQFVGIWYVENNGIKRIVSNGVFSDQSKDLNLRNRSFSITNILKYINWIILIGLIYCMINILQSKNMGLETKNN